MPQQKSFWRKYEFLIIAIATLILVYLVVLFNQKINFFLGNELIVYLTPGQKSFSMHYGDAANAVFDISIDNAAYCRAECSYSFTDRSSNEIIDIGDFEIGKNEHFTKSYELRVRRLGSGQDIYSFEASCRSVRSHFCFTKGAEKSRASLVTVDYDLSETEKELKKILRQNVTELLELLSEVDVLHQQLNQKYFELGHKVNLDNLTKQKIDIDDSYDKTRISIENLRSLWAVENYIRLNELFNESFSETLGTIWKSIGSLDSGINSVVQRHNRLLLRLEALSGNLNGIHLFANATNDTQALSSAEAQKGRLNALHSSIINNTLESYEKLSGEIAAIESSREILIESTIIPAAELFFRLQYSIEFGNDLLCSLKGDCRDNISIKKPVKDAENFIGSYPDSKMLRQGCAMIKDLNTKFADARNESSKELSNKSISLGNESLNAANEFKDSQIIKINNSYYDDLERIKLENRTDAAAVTIAESILPKNRTDAKPFGYNYSLALISLSQIKLDDESLELLDKCSRLPKERFIALDFGLVSANITYKISSGVDTSLSDNPPICCIFSDCKPCCNDELCRNNPKTFPVIFLHGHSFAKGNSPEFSLDSFNKLQSKLQDDGYLNAGIVSLYSQNEKVQKGIWGLSGKPVTVKASYYYDAFRKEDKYIVVPTKSESIDAYALRLRDLIEIVKSRTDKPKVNIIAHSMGGLVARRYIQIFGEENIDKLIMIATPNKGISGSAGDYCGYVGENRECGDMQENSLFMNKLNDASKQPENVKLYSIIGQGCQMKAGDGDGIVLAESLKLDNSKLFYVNGSCDGLFGARLHTEILNTEKYPETYRIAAEILKE